MIQPRNLDEARAIGEGALGLCKDNGARVIGKACDQHFGQEGADLLGWKVDDGEDLPSDQFSGRVMRGDLGRRTADADFCTEIDPKLDRGFASFGEGFCLGDGSDTEIDFLKVLPSDCGHIGGRRCKAK